MDQGTVGNRDIGLVSYFDPATREWEHVTQLQRYYLGGGFVLDGPYMWTHRMHCLYRVDLTTWEVTAATTIRTPEAHPAVVWRGEYYFNIARGIGIGGLAHWVPPAEWPQESKPGILFDCLDEPRRG